MLELIVQENASDIQRVFGALQAEFSALKINGAEDKEGMEVARKAFYKVRGFRIDWEKAGDGLVKKVNEAKKKFQGELATEIAKFKELEASITAEIKRVEKEIEDAKLEAEAAAEKRFVDRTTKMFDVGFTYNGHLYVVGAMAYNPQHIDEMDDDTFEEMLVRGKQEAENVKAFLEYAAKQKADLEKASAEALAKEALEKQALENFSLPDKVLVSEESVMQPEVKEWGVVHEGALDKLPFDDLPFDEYLEGKSDDHVVIKVAQWREDTRAAVLPPNNANLPTGYTMGFDACRQKILKLIEELKDHPANSGELLGSMYAEIAEMPYV